MGLKLPGCEVDHSPSFRAGCRMNGAIYLIFPYTFVPLKGTVLTYVFKICKYGDIVTFRRQFQQIFRKQIANGILKETMRTDVSLKHVFCHD